MLLSPLGERLGEGARTSPIERYYFVVAVRKYTIDDIQVLNDPVETIRRLYSEHRDGGPGASYCAAALLQQIILLRATPVRVEQRGDWIFVSSECDWLASSEGAPSKRPFFQLAPFPEGGQNSHRAEILLTAFAAAVVNAGSDGVEWIVSNAEHHPLPDTATLEQIRNAGGRVIAFVFADAKR